MAEERSVPLHLASPPGYDWLVIVEAPGLVFVLEGDSLLSEPFLDLRNEVNYPYEQGLLGLEFDPNFEARRDFLRETTPTSMAIPVCRASAWVRTPRRADRATEERLFSIPRLNEFHNAGKIQFGPDGYMWISTGDGFDSGTAQDPTNLRGSIIRIDVNGAYPYGDPARQSVRIRPGGPPGDLDVRVKEPVALSHRSGGRAGLHHRRGAPPS